MYIHVRGVTSIEAEDLLAFSGYMNELAEYIVWWIVNKAIMPSLKFNPSYTPACTCKQVNLGSLHWESFLCDAQSTVYVASKSRPSACAQHHPLVTFDPPDKFSRQKAWTITSRDPCHATSYCVYTFWQYWCDVFNPRALPDCAGVRVYEYSSLGAECDCISDSPV